MSEFLLPTPWIEVAIVVALLGAVVTSRFGDPIRAWRVGLGFILATFLSTVTACVCFYVCKAVNMDYHGSVHSTLLNREILAVDELNAPLLPLLGLLHFLTALATGRTKMRRFSLEWSLAAEAVRVATFACLQPVPLIVLLAVGSLLGVIELTNRGKPTRFYAMHMSLFVALLMAGQTLANSAETATLASVLLAGGILIRCGAIPAHCWLIDWFERASFGNALLFATPLIGVYAAVRLVLPIAPDWVLETIGLLSLGTAIYASGMAVVQLETRRMFAYLFLSHASLVLVGLELHTPISLSGSLALWFSTALSLAGLGLTLRALEARFGRLSLADFHGLYEQAPALAVCFALTGLACVGFPGTLGFIATELLVDGAVEADLYVGIGVILATAINGIAILRAYFMLFTGKRHHSSISANITLRERIAVSTLTVLILAGGFLPQPGIVTRHRAAVEILHDRQSRLGEPSQHAAAKNHE